MIHKSRWQTIVLFGFIAMTLLAASTASAQWSRDPNLNTEVVLGGSGITNYFNTSVPDGSGGVIMGWIESEGTSSFVAQRVDNSGTRLWGDQGTVVIPTADILGKPKMAPDGNGGFFLTWSQVAGSSSLVFAQHFNAAGNSLWSSGGVLMQQFVLAGTVQVDPQIVADTVGGIVIAWVDATNAVSNSIYAMRINSFGYRSWSSAVVSQTYRDVSGMVMAAGPNPGEVCLAWAQDSSVELGWDIYGQTMSSTGVAQWSTSSQKVLSESTGDQKYPQVISFGEGGLFAVFMEPSTGRYVYQGKDQDGDSDFGNSGTTLQGMYDFERSPQLVKGPDQSVYVVFQDVSTTVGVASRIAAKVFMPRVDWQWGRDGKTVHEITAGEIELSTLADESGGFFVVCSDMNQYNLTATHMNALGESNWPDEKVLFSYRINEPYEKVDLVSDGENGFIASWLGIDVEDWSYTPVAQKIDYNGFLADNGFGMLTVEDRPNDQGGELIASWQASPLDNSLNHAIASYSVWVEYLGSIPLAKANTATDELRVANAALAVQLGMAEAEVTAMVAAGWTFAGQVPAVFATEYSAFCPSFGDSTTTEMHLTGVRVVAHHEDSSIFWTSLGLEGYSVDNLTPGAPLELAGVNNAGVADLSWTASGSYDEDLAEYRVYRGDVSGFVLAENTLVGNSQTTVFSDNSAGGVVYYRVTAVDVHGNESHASAEVTVQLAISGVADLPVAFSHQGNYPNPFNPMTRIAFDMPKTAQVSVSVYDVGGRLVSTLLSETLAAGHHEVRWNGLDSNGRSVSSGVYFSRVAAGENVAMRSMMLVR